MRRHFMSNKQKNRGIYFILGLFLLFFVPSVFTQEPIEDDVGWPRVLEHPKGKITIYQPQVDRFEDNIIEGRSAVSVVLTGETEPFFGAIWYKARVETDRDTRMVNIIDLKIPRIRFPDSTPEQEKGLAEFLEQEIPKWDMNISLDRLLAGLDLAEKERIAAENLKNDPPKILIEYDPSILVLIDGEPIMEKIENSSLERVVNTPFLIVQDTKSRAYYLNGGDLWMTSSNIKGPWKEAKSIPREVSQITPKDPEDVPKFEAADNRLPKVIVATEPTELIVIDGKPEYAPIQDTDLLYVTNTESDLLMDMASQQYLVLLSGRWYASKSLSGSWAYVPSDRLPESCKNIPEDSENGHLLSFIAGTEQAKEAVLDAEIPQTSAIQRDSGKDLKVEYDGNPKFEKAEGTEVEYSVNTSSAVFKVENTYYCCSEAVWYVSRKADGPWDVCDKVPDVIYTIPPSCPHYNTKYVYVYDSTPSVVYVGYYPGYMGSYIYGPTVVYGTGWYYRPWYGTYYYPHHWTWGFHVRWNPWYGWSFGFSFGSGPFRFNVGFGGWGGGWWGPAYPRPYGYPGGHRAAYRAGYRAGYWHGASRGGAPRPTPYGSRSNVYNRPKNINRNIQKTQLQDRQRPNVAQGQRNNVYTDRNGDVYRRQDNGDWQKRENGKWSSTQRPSTQDRAQTRQPSTKASSRSTLERQYQSRKKGTARTHQFQSIQKSSGARTRRR
jgi:hypothetical protein